MEKRTRRTFTREFKAETVALVRTSGKSMRLIGRDLGLAETTLQRWVGQAETDAGRREGLTTAERDELSQLRRELRVVREERDVLAKAIAFFACMSTVVRPDGLARFFAAQPHLWLALESPPVRPLGSLGVT